MRDSLESLGQLRWGDRRSFLRNACRLAALAYAGQLLPAAATPLEAQGTDALLAGRPLVRYPEKTDLILLTSRPPQLETPLKYFETAITPNDAFYVRYHIPPPTDVDLFTWRLKITGHLDKPLDLSLDDLQGKFPRTS